MIIRAFPSGPFATNAYVLACPATRKAAIIDPGVESGDAIIEFISQNKLSPKKILLTHTHWDHTADVSYLKNHFHIPVFVHQEDAPNLKNPGSDGLPMLFPIESAEPDGWLEEGQRIEIGNLSLQIIHTPGHSPGGVCFYESHDHVLISGDTLFKGTIGNLSFPTSRPQLMWASLKKLAELPPETQVYPGHGESTTIGNEKWLRNAEKIFGD